MPINLVSSVIVEMQRILVFSIDEVAVDYQSVGKAVNAACRRDHTEYQVQGLCQTNDSVLFTLEEKTSENNVRYIIAPFSGTSNDDVKADIYTRWSSGFSTKGLIRLSDIYVGLFESSEPNHLPELHTMPMAESNNNGKEK